MKKKILLLIVFVMSFLCLMMSTYAETKYVTMLDAVNIRKGPATTYGSYKVSQAGSTYNLVSDTKVADEAKNGNCDEGWYEIEYSEGKAYVCAAYVQVYTTVEDGKAASTVCELEMQKAGFPSSYWSGLCSLKEKHPNWVFKSIQTNLEWTGVVDKQSACGKSLIQTSNSEYLDSSCSAYDGSFKAASQKAVAFYMDPRNFLTEKYIFQFEYLKYDEDLASEYAGAVTKIIGNAAFYTYHKNLGNDLSEYIVQAGKETNVSPIFLASRIYQELGAQTSLYNLYSGVYTGDDNKYYGYYNFYNIGITSTCNNQYGTTYCGLNTAYNRGWQGLYTAIKGGASFLANDYINVGQYTSYLQKYNVDPTDKTKLHTHQYMTNVMGPSSEAISTYNAYNKAGLLDKAFVFYIPVYTNMGATIANTPSGGTTDTSSSSSPITTDISTIITNAGYKISGDYVTNMKVGSTVSEVQTQIEAIAGSGNVSITNASGSVISSGKIGTGSKIKVTNANGAKTYTVVIKGDTSGDGVINALDLLQVQKSILGTYTLKDAYLKAGDTSGDSKVNALDLLQIQKNILGTYSIEQ